MIRTIIHITTTVVADNIDSLLDLDLPVTRNPPDL